MLLCVVIYDKWVKTRVYYAYLIDYFVYLSKGVIDLYLNFIK